MIKEQATKRVNEADEDTDGLEWYLVGGAVRDIILGNDTQDYDYMVVGETRESMKQRGFEFIDNETHPVFHSTSGDEYALAREETSTAKTHNGYEYNTEGVTVEDDLARRDFTMNAIAWNPCRGFVDPYNGIDDIKDGVIRHVPDSFEDDPLRVLRAARFTARFPLRITTETKEAMERMKDDLHSLTAERKRQELAKTFKEAQRPSTFISVLRETRCLAHTYPCLSGMQSVEAREEEQGSTLYEQSLHVLDEATGYADDKRTTGFMALYHCVGRVGDMDEIISRVQGDLLLSNRTARAIRVAARYHDTFRLDRFSPGEVYDWFDGLSYPYQLLALLLGRGRCLDPVHRVRVARYLRCRRLVDAVKKAITGDTLIAEGITPDSVGGEEFGRRLRELRVNELRNHLG